MVMSAAVSTVSSASFILLNRLRNSRHTFVKVFFKFQQICALTISGLVRFWLRHLRCLLM
jgi:hypothetical protein